MKTIISSDGKTQTKVEYEVTRRYNAGLVSYADLYVKLTYSNLTGESNTFDYPADATLMECISSGYTNYDVKANLYYEGGASIPESEATDKSTMELMTLAQPYFVKISGGSGPRVKSNSVVDIAQYEGTFTVSTNKNYGTVNLDYTLSYNPGNLEKVTLTIDPLPNGKLKVNGSWKNGKFYIKKNGVWKRAVMFRKINGSWILGKGNY